MTTVEGDAHPPFLNAGNAGPFTLDGTRTYRVGLKRAVLLDPGPDVASHVRALVAWMADADEVVIVVTHGHADHAGAAPAVAAALGAPVVGPATVAAVTSPLADGGVVETDLGELVAVHTPGHIADHLCFHWPRRRALFAGDLLLGRGDTTWVAEYPGCVADYLDSLRRVRDLGVDVIYPAHGPALVDATAALDRFESHRVRRIRQVEEGLAADPGASPRQLLPLVYGKSLPAAVEAAAIKSLEALLDHVRGESRS
ncbi:MAG: MBL fold metallo-hydrolase [Gemmatimonadetes bacterium]|nr:MBL fold metallo-hydrolase [Gemmatimonadota bacterium]